MPAPLPMERNGSTVAFSADAQGGSGANQASREYVYNEALSRKLNVEAPVVNSDAGKNETSTAHSDDRSASMEIVSVTDSMAASTRRIPSGNGESRPLPSGSQAAEIPVGNNDMGLKDVFSEDISCEPLKVVLTEDDLVQIEMGRLVREPLMTLKELDMIIEGWFD